MKLINFSNNSGKDPIGINIKPINMAIKAISCEKSFIVYFLLLKLFYTNKLK